LHPAAPKATASVGKRVPVEVTLSAKDPISGVKLISYRLDGGGWKTYSAPIKVVGKGAHAVAFRAVDNAGNQSPTGSVPVRIR
jgi:hypothetical protein